MKTFTAAVFLAALTVLPAAHSQEAKTMTTANKEIALAQHLIDLHFEIWNTTNPEHWKARFPQAYTTDFFLADYNGVATGYAAVSQKIKQVQAEHAGFSFRPDPVVWNHGMGRVTWGYGPRDHPDLVRGEDIFTIENGKLASARVFIDQK